MGERGASGDGQGFHSWRERGPGPSSGKRQGKYVTNKAK